MHENIVLMQIRCNAWSFSDQIFKTHPKNFAKISSIWKVPNIFQKPQILGQKIWKCMKKKD